MNKLTIALLFISVIPATATEKWYRVFGPNGNTFIVTCRAAVQKIDNPDWQGTKQEAHESGYCMGFVSAVAEHMNEEGGVDLSDAAITRDQLIRVVQKYMEDHPQELSKPASWLIRQALIKAFPVHNTK
jgi:hypothetical protein